MYGGETIIVWSEKKQSLAAYYFTTAGFTTVGTMTVKDGHIATRETVEGDANGVSEVRGTSELRPDGTVRVKSEYLKEGKWEPGHAATYRHDPAAKITFK